MNAVAICHEDELFLKVFRETAEFTPSDPAYAPYFAFNLSAIERGRDLVRELNPFARIFGANVLDIGAGSGGTSIAMAEAGANVSALEPDRRRFRWAEARILGHRANVVLASGVAEDLPYPAETFDLVIIDNVIEHVDNPSKVIFEISRVLRPGGVVFLATPNKMSLLTIFRDPHYQMFGVVLMSRAIGKFYVEKVRRNPRGYWVNLIPTRGWLDRQFSRNGLKAKFLPFEGFEKLRTPELISERNRAVKKIAIFAKQLNLTSALEGIALSQATAIRLIAQKQS